jgi:hypothetical protein
MKTSTKYVSLAATASLAAVALFVIANSSITSRFPFGVVFSITASTALVGIIAYDYSRRTKSPRFCGRLLRPAMPATKTPINIAVRLEKPARAERMAA